MNTVSFQGLEGPIDCAIELPEGTPRGWALVLHPHPLHGGARDNKIVTTIARACVQAGLVAVRPNFRGVGKSAGSFDNAVGETGDMRDLVRQFAQAYPEAAAGRWVLAGFSFGTAVAAQLFAMLDEERAGGAAAPLPDAMVLVGTAVERFRFRSISLPEHTLVVHGEADEVVPLDEAMGFARAQGLPLVVVPDGSHFFHGKLIMLRNLVQDRLALL